MRAKNDYDIVIIGDQLGAYVLAAAAVQLGFKVLIVEGNPIPKTIFTAPAGDFLIDPFWEPIQGLSNGGIIDEFFKKIGLYQDMSEMFYPLQPELQMVGPKFRVDLNYKKEIFQKEFSREFPGSLGKELGAIFSRQMEEQSVYKQGIVSKKIAEKNLPAWIESIVKAQLSLFGKVLPQKLYETTLGLSLRKSANGVCFAFGGRGMLEEHLVAKIRAHGGEIKKKAYVEEIVFEKGKLKGILLSSFEAYINCRHVVSSIGLRDFLRLLPVDFKPRSITRHINAMRPKFWRFSFAIHVEEDSLPEGMGPHLVFLDPTQALVEENLLQVFVPPREIYPRMAKATRTILLRVLVPYEKESLDPRFLSALIKRSLVTLKKYVPFLKIQIVSPSPDNLSQDDVYKRIFRFNSLDDIPASFLVFDEILDASCASGIPVDWSKEGIPGIWSCSRDVSPLYGSIGEITAAKDLLASLLIQERKLGYERRGTEKFS